MTWFKVHGSKQLPDGLIVLFGLVEGPRLIAGQCGVATLASGGIEIEVTSVGMTDPKMIDVGVQTIVAMLRIGNYAPMGGAVLEFR